MDHISKLRLLGSSTPSLIFFKNKTASLPSNSLWSYVKAKYIIGLITTCPSLTTGLSNVACIPKIADCGGLIKGVPIKDPNTPPFEIVNVPPLISSRVILPAFPFFPRASISFYIS